MVFFPDGRLEPLSAGVTDGHVGKEPVVVPGHQRHGQPGPELVIRARREDVVAKGAAAGVGDPRWIVEEGCQVSFAALRDIHVSMRLNLPPLSWLAKVVD